MDIVLFNLLTSRLQWSKIRANMVSASVAMTCSFLANWHWVFPAHGGHPAERAARFLAVTLASGWLVQNGVLRLLDAAARRLLTKLVGPACPQARVNLLHPATSSKPPPSPPACSATTPPIEPGSSRNGGEIGLRRRTHVREGRLRRLSFGVKSPAIAMKP